MQTPEQLAAELYDASVPDWETLRLAQEGVDIVGAELYEFFGGDAGTDLPMKMTWHHLAFNEGNRWVLASTPFKCTDAIMASSL